MRNYRPEPRGGVSAAHPDGLYLAQKPDSKQVLMVGPSGTSPREILDDFPGHKIRSVTVLPPPEEATDDMAQVIWGRLYLLVIIELA